MITLRIGTLSPVSPVLASVGPCAASVLTGELISDFVDAARFANEQASLAFKDGRDRDGYFWLDMVFDAVQAAQ
jgi:hypothetical protein